MRENKAKKSRLKNSLEILLILFCLSPAFLGATDKAQESVWRWISNYDLAEIPREWWSYGDPNNANENEHCLAMSQLFLVDVPCTISYNSICQKCK